MKIALVHNAYGKHSGEEQVVENQQRLFKQNGIDVFPFFRTSADIETMSLGKIRAFFSGIYSLSSKLAFRTFLANNQPDIVHIHNLFPLISPSILPECSRAKIPLVMTVHNYRLVCPNGLHMTQNRRCERCVGGKEYWCILKNCESNHFKSLGYALRNLFAREMGFYKNHVDRFAVLTDFQRQRLIQAGFSEEKITVIPNMMVPKPTQISSKHATQSTSPGHFVGFSGRVTPEKWIYTLIEVARRNPDIPFKIAGNHTTMNFSNSLPDNLELLGHLDSKSLHQFYESSRIMVLCSLWFEGFPMVILEAMSYSKPVICSRIGGLPEVVSDQQTGLLFAPGDVMDLESKIRHLWNQPELCHQMGIKAQKKAERDYSESVHWSQLKNLYHAVKKTET